VVGGIGIVEFISLEDESETGHGSGADNRNGGGHGEAVGLGGGGRRGRVLLVAAAAGGGGSGSGGSSGRDGLSPWGTVIISGVSSNALAGGVGGECVSALKTNISSGSELNDGVGRGGTDVGGAADGVQLGVDVDVGSRRYDRSEDGDEGSQQSSVGGSLDVGDDNASGVSRGGGDCASGACAAAAVGLVLAVVGVAVGEDGGGKAEDEAVLDLHIEGWRLFLGGG
jgi:hypothetical protein